MYREERHTLGCAAMRKLALLAILVLSCKTAPEAKPAVSDQPPTTAAPPTAVAKSDTPAPGIDLSILDRSVNPCDDFYKFACGKWLERTPIPPDRAQWGRGFSEILERNELKLKEILEKDARGEPDPADPFAQKVGDFYSTCMDEEKAETASLATLRKELEQIDAIQDGKALAAEVGALNRTGGRAFFNFFSRQDAKDSKQVIGGVDQGGLGLPDRDYNFK